MKIRGTAHKFADNVDTDVIIPARYLNTPDAKELAAHLKQYGIRVRDYDDVIRYLERRSEHDVVLIDPNKVSDTLANALPTLMPATAPVNRPPRLLRRASISAAIFR